MKPSLAFKVTAGMRLICSTLVVIGAVAIKQSSPLELSLLDVEAEAMSQASTHNGPLFSVSVTFDWKKHNPAEGVTVKMDKASGNLQMVSGISTNSGDIAWGYMKEELSKDGWIKLYLQTAESESVTNDVRMYAAGFIEGMLTAVRISQFYSNFYQTIMKDVKNEQALSSIKKVFEDEIEFVKKNANFKPGAITTDPIDPYWKHMRYQFVQLWAMKDGYNFVATHKGVRSLDLIDFMMINSHAELPELMQAYMPEAIKKRQSFQKGPSLFLQKEPVIRAPPLDNAMLNLSTQAIDDDWESRLVRRGRCSAFVRMAPENKDLLVGHTTWGDYAKMMRIFKYYHFTLPGASTKATVMGFSSYPGCISSTDDFYELDSGLVVMDTSLEILNSDMYNRVAEFPSNAHVPDFMHVMVANRMASSAAHWAALFSEKNSGTDNAQWMIVDYNRFLPGRPIRDGTLWVLEQVPGIMFKKDMSSMLRDQGYFASYNRPYFPQVRTASGHTAAEAKYGTLFSYDKGPRASIFKTVAPLSEHLMDMRSIMNRNNWPGEGILPNEPGHAISARMDLSASKIPNGGIDAKVVNRCLFRSMQCQAISGPSHTKQTVFKWKDGAADTMQGWPHLGLPDVWDFDWVQMTPTAPLKHLVDVSDCA